MGELELSPEARRRLWQCYSLLLQLADEAEESITTDSELIEDNEPATETGVNELIQPDNDTAEIDLEQTEQQHEKHKFLEMSSEPSKLEDKSAHS